MKIKLLVFTFFPLSLWAQCAGPTSVTITPDPDNAAIPGLIPQGGEVTVCVTVDGYEDPSLVNWFHGLAFDFGPGWDAASVTNIQAPIACIPFGNWDWYTSILSGSGDTYGPGFFYDEDNNGVPGDGFGDDDIFNSCRTFLWQFCFDIRVASTATDGDDLSIVAQVLSDSQSGAWLSGTGGCLAEPSLPANTVPMQVGCPLTTQWQVSTERLRVLDPLQASVSGLGIQNVVWTTGDGNIATGNTLTHSYAEPGTYRLSATVQGDACSTVLDTLITATPLPTLQLANAFSPNGDGLNEAWEVAENGFVYQLRIVDRWGNIVHSQTGRNVSWDGANAVSGVYVYQLEWERGSREGNIHLLR